jgi:large conductance mechanosensitive channel
VITLQEASKVDGKDIPAVVVRYGSFINAVVDFAIVAFAIFIVIKMINTARVRFEAKQDAPAAAPPEDILLLREIRDALAKR